MTGARFIGMGELESLMPLIEKDECILLDVRSPVEFRSGHIRHTRSMPAEELVDRSNELEMGKKLVVYCRSGKRSLRVLPMLTEIGYADVLVLEGGLERWTGDLVSD